MVLELQHVTVEVPAPETAVVVFSGEHDLATKREVKKLLSSLVELNELVVADFSHASFVDSSILGVLLEVNELATREERTFRLQLGTAAIVRRVFELMGMYELLDVSPTREEALGERR